VASRERRAALVATSSDPGTELATAVRDLAGRKGFAVDVLTNPAQPDVARALTRYDVVILDATVEPGRSYPGFTAPPRVMNHVLVVSRTPLPLNFHGLREGGAPPYPAGFSNGDLLSWLDTQLDELRDAPARSRLERTLLGSVLTMARSGPPRREPGRQVFVSYRGEAVDEARQLADRLSAGKITDPAGAPLTATFLEPGEIAFEDEILTSWLRWHLVSLLAERLRRCESLWICDSPNYFTSWWSRAELVLCRYLKTPGHGQRRIRIWRYDLASGQASPADGIVPALTEGQRRRLGRLLSSAGRSMGADTVRLSGQPGEVPVPRRSSFWDDDVFTGGFANVALLDVTPHGTGSPLTTEDIDAVLHAREEDFMVVPPDVLAAAIPGHPAEFSGYRISREALPRYLFSRGSLEPLPVFRAARIEH
jgi:hypothetical protein